jgi:hypothetical protein
VAETRSRTYLDLLDRIHRAVLPRGYVEIGVRDGASLAIALPGTRAVAIDPVPIIDKKHPGHTRVFPLISGDYFASRDLVSDVDRAFLDMAFIDGMHPFEFSLRDFTHIERHAHADTVVLVHDCYPVNEATPARDCTTECWSGDVWRLIACLKQSRPDLRISVVEVPPTGLAIITGLDPASTVLADRYDDLVRRYVDAPYATLGDKAATLNRIDNDWSKIAPATPRSVPPRRASSRFQRGCARPSDTPSRKRTEIFRVLASWQHGVGRRRAPCRTTRSSDPWSRRGPRSGVTSRACVSGVCSRLSCDG